MPTPKTKKRRINPPVKEIDDSHSKAAPTTATTTESATNGTMAEEKVQNFETLQLHAGYFYTFSSSKLSLD
jgi:hypothetical protein